MKTKNLNGFRLDGAEMLGRDELKSILGGGLGGVVTTEDDATVLCNDGTRHDTSDCERATAEAACGDHGGPDSCAH